MAAAEVSLMIPSSDTEAGTTICSVIPLAAVIVLVLLFGVM